MARVADDGREVLENEEVMSEVHLGCPPRYPGYYISRFSLTIPRITNNVVLGGGGKHGKEVSVAELLPVDDDGDLVLTRRREKGVDYEVAVQHRITSPLSTVGLQLWKAALLLADFVIYKISMSSEFSNVVALELGAGTGIVGFILARVAKTVFLTDSDDEVLRNCAVNACLNSRLFECNKSNVHIKKLDWKKSWPPVSEGCTAESSSMFTYAWTSTEIEEAEGASLLLAADVIYSDELTDSFFKTLEIFMSRNIPKVLYLALEKRYNFSFDDLDVVATGYSHFRSFLKDEARCSELQGRSGFLGKKIDTTEIPQYVKGYDRGKDLELWKITYSAVV